MLSKKSCVFLWKFALLVLICGLLLAVSCPPKINNFSPGSGEPGDEVVVEGKYFEETPTNNIVKFKDVTATDISVPEKNKIIAKVPQGAKTGLISVTTSAGTGYSKHHFVVISPARWTFMVYLDGDNNLESAAIDDFLEMAQIGSSDQVKIVVQMDRHPASNWPYSAAYDNWTGTRRFLIGKEDTPSVTPIQDLGEQNMGDPATLQNFVEWAVTTFPADHYALSIWNHGEGWRLLMEKIMANISAARSRGEPNWSLFKYVAIDNTDNDMLYMKEVQQALEAARSQIKDRNGTLVKLDIMGFDACLMGMVEVAFALRNAANYMVGSEELEPGDGWPYDTILSDLVATPSLSPEDVAKLIVTKYGNAYNSGVTQSAVDINELSNLVAKIDTFTVKAKTEWSKIKTARSNAREYHPSWTESCWGVDLWDFADRVFAQASATDTKIAALELKNAINNFVINEYHSPDMAGSHGIAIYFPPNQQKFNNDPDQTGYEEDNTYMVVDFVIDHLWDNWLKDFYSNIP